MAVANKPLNGYVSTRTATRANLDPKPNPSMSPFAMFGGNPIIYSDILLDTPTTAWGTPVTSPTNIPLRDNASIAEVHFTWLMNKTMALKPILWVEKRERKRCM